MCLRRCVCVCVTLGVAQQGMQDVAVFTEKNTQGTAQMYHKQIHTHINTSCASTKAGAQTHTVQTPTHGSWVYSHDT